VSESTQHHIESAQLRRSPRYAIFFVLGAALGILAALILTFAFDGTAEKSPSTQVLYSTSQVFGFLCLVCIPIGLALGGVVAPVRAPRARGARRPRAHRGRLPRRCGCPRTGGFARRGVSRGIPLRHSKWAH